MEGAAVKLDDLALKYGTDKSSKDHDYCPYYEQYLMGWRDVPITLLELGVWQGASLRMWREYFSNATILGVDHHDRDLNIPGVSTFLVKQDDKEQLDLLAAIYGDFDVVIDDCSHISSLTISSFCLLWPHLRSGGIYVIEDLQTSYDVKNYGEDEAVANPNSHLMERSYTAMGFCKRLADEVNRGLYKESYRLGYDVASVQFFPNICFIRKS